MATSSFQLLNTELQQGTQHSWLEASLERTWLSEVAIPGMGGQVHQAVNQRYNNHLTIITESLQYRPTGKAQSVFFCSIFLKD